MEYWDTEDYFTLLTEHAIRGLMLMGAPHPVKVLQDRSRAGWGWLCCCREDDLLSGWEVRGGGRRGECAWGQ